jgi:hypothetical protein
MLGTIIHGRSGLKLIGMWHGTETPNGGSGFCRRPVAEPLEPGPATGIVIKELIARAAGLAGCGRRHSLFWSQIVHAVAHEPAASVHVVPLTEPPRGHEYAIVAD